MKRRTLLKTLTGGLLLATTAGWLWRKPAAPLPAKKKAIEIIEHDPEPRIEHDPEPRLNYKVKHFNRDFVEDVYLPEAKWPLLQQTVRRMERLQKYIGYANFSLLGFDEMLRYARQFSVIGAFSPEEKSFLEEIFSNDAHNYGFFGDKVLTRLTAVIPHAETIKIPRSGNFLFRGESLKMFQRVQKDVGQELILTSGIRGVSKQLYLFLAKVEKTRGNLSRASRSLAPPGHSYHGIGDFDVGQRGLGRDNFTARFAKSQAFNKLRELGYINIRYTPDNQVGVRYEPWHIKVV